MLYLNICKLQATMVNVCSIVITIIKKDKDNSNVSLEIIGDTRIRFKKPNSLSKIKGSPAFKALVKDVKTIIPELKN